MQKSAEPGGLPFFTQFSVAQLQSKKSSSRLLCLFSFIFLYFFFFGVS